VFIAMLALNIGKEVLATIGVINEDLTNSINQFKDNSSVIYKKFDDLGVSEPAWAEALPVINELKKYSDEYSQYLNSVQDFLLSSDKEGKNFKRVVENKSDDSKPDVDMTNYQIMDASVALDEKFFDGDKYTEDGKEYVANFQNFQSNLLVVIDSLKTLKIFKDYSAGFDLDKIELEKRFEFTEFKLNSEGKELPYLDYEFKGFPLIASLSKITKTHNNLRYIENKILNTALGNIRVGSRSIVDLVPTLSQDQQFFTGQTFGGKIILAQESDLQVFNSIDLTLNGPGNSNRTLVEDVDFTVVRGQIVFKNRISRAGLYTLKGKISKKGENGTVDYDISKQERPLTFTIIDEPSNANIEAIRMNILYIGLSNPVNISIPGVDQSSLVPVNSSDSNVRLNRNVSRLDRDAGANFYAKPIALGNAKIQVRGQLNGETIVSNEKIFRVKNIEKGIGAIINDRTYKAGESISQNNILDGEVSGFKPDNFDYDFNVKVTKFTISVGNNQALTVEGNFIEGLARDYIRQASSGETINFSSIEAIGWEGDNISDSFKYEINDFFIKKQ
jgi:gliding motility-associated protein GldM